MTVTQVTLFLGIPVHCFTSKFHCSLIFFFSKVELYYMILERLEKYQEALDVVRGKLGGNLFCQLIITDMMEQ